MYNSIGYSQATKSPLQVSKLFLNHTWNDQNGQKFQFIKANSEHYAIAIAYTSCKSVCPMVTQQISALRKKLSEDNINFPFYFISIDPKRDDFEHRKAFLNKFGSGLEWRFLATSLKTTHQLVAELGMGFSDPGSNDHAMHTLTLAILNQKGKILTSIAILPEETAASVKKIKTVLQPKSD